MRRTEDPDRHMQKRADGGFRYVRRVPARALVMLRRHEPEYPETIRRSLDTHNRDEARAKRDAMAKADDDYWSAAEAGAAAQAVDAYDRAVARARSLKVEYRPAADLARDASLDEILQRIRMISGPSDRVTADAVLGGAGEKSTTIDQAFETFETVIRKADLARKSPWQLLKWRQLKQRGISNFKREVGDIAIEDTTRAHALKFHAYWLGRIVPDEDESGEKAKALSASAGNKDMDTMRSLWGEYMAHIGREDLPNPFRKLRFKDRIQRTRPAFSETWIRDHILKSGALDALNTEARIAVLVLINTGARPSEIVNLDADRIILEAPVPYLDIRETTDRELKVVASARRIPLAGVSLEAIRQARKGFAQYRDKDNLSATVNKFFRENELMETDEHTLYSLRHGFEARLKLAEVDEELRRYLMGHAIKRPKYGYTEDLRWSAGAIAKIAL